MEALVMDAGDRGRCADGELFKFGVCSFLELLSLFSLAPLI
jgi:hypothetical protein